LGAAHTESEPSHFAADFAEFGLIAIIFGSGRSEVNDVIVSVQLVGHVTQGNVGLTGFVGVDDRIGVEAQHLLLQLVKIQIELETGPAGGEGGHEDVDALVIDLVLAQV